MKRGAVTKRGSKLVTVWVPQSLAGAMDQAIDITDTDRSKFIREAVREKLRKAEEAAAVK